MKLSKLILLKESKASEMAHKLGLIYLGYGYWADKSAPRVPVAKTMNGYLVKLEKKDHEFLAHNDPKSDPTGEANKDDDWYDPDVKKISTDQYFTGVKNKSQAPSYSSGGGGVFGGGGGYFGGGGGHGGYYGGGSGSWEDKPPKQPKLPEDLPLDKVMTFKSDSSGSGTMNDSPMTGNNYSINGVSLSSWKNAPEKPKKKWREEGKKEDILKWQGVEGTNLDLIEPELELTGYNKAAAGVVIMEPDGRIWVVEPTGHFAGYQHSIPKGTCDPELDIQESAIKEAYEESGLQVQIVDYIGDVDKSASTSRYYLAKRVGGNPLDHGWETHAVRLVSTDDIDKFLNNGNDQNLVKEIKKRKQEFIGKVTGKIPPSDSTKKNDLTSDYSKKNTADDLARPQYGSTKGKQEKLMYTKYGEQAGTNEGGFYIGADGIKRYIKLYHNAPEKAMGEVLTSYLLKDLRIAAPDTKYFATDEAAGEYGFASTIVPNVKGELLDIAKKTGPGLYDYEIPKEVADQILDGFIADVLTANWDVVGSMNEGFLRNIVLVDDGSKHGKPVRIDNGSGFLHRGLTGRKPEHTLYGVKELEVFFQNNPGYQVVTKSAGFNSADQLGFERLSKQLKNVLSLFSKEKGWEVYVNKVIPDLESQDKEKIIKMLYMRTKALIDYVNSMRGSEPKVGPEKPKETPVTTSPGQPIGFTNGK